MDDKPKPIVTVGDLIEVLKQFPLDAQVGAGWEGIWVRINGVAWAPPGERKYVILDADDEKRLE